MSSFKKKGNAKKPQQGAGKIRMQGAKPKAQPSRQVQIKQAMMESDSEDHYDNNDNNEQMMDNQDSESSEEMGGDEFDLDQMEEDSDENNNG